MNPMNYTPSQGYSTRSQILRRRIQGRIFRPYNHGRSEPTPFHAPQANRAISGTRVRLGLPASAEASGRGQEVQGRLWRRNPPCLRVFISKKLAFSDIPLFSWWGRWFAFCAKPHVTNVHTEHHLTADNILREV